MYLKENQMPLVWKMYLMSKRILNIYHNGHLRSTYKTIFAWHKSLFYYSEYCLSTMPMGENIQQATSVPNNFAMISPIALYEMTMANTPYTFQEVSGTIEFTLLIPTVITSIEIRTTGSVKITDITTADDSPFTLNFVSWFRWFCVFTNANKN